MSIYINKPLFPQGVITGANFEQEWMLPAWFDSYKKYNDSPILFIDFGMSESAKRWCKKRGELITLTPQKTPLKQSIAQHIPDAILEKRAVWFQKPKALLSTLFKKSIWVDVDVLFFGTVQPIFDLIKDLNALAMRKEIAIRADSERSLNLVPQKATSYNTGVVAYMWGCLPIAQWCENLDICCKSHLGDQDSFSTFLYKSGAPVILLPEYMHQIHPEEKSHRSIIYHFASSAGKNAFLEAKTVSSLPTE